MRTWKLAAVGAALLTGSGVAEAQVMGPGTSSPANVGYTAINPEVANPGDTTTRDASRARDEAVDRQRDERKDRRQPRSVPATPSDVSPGADVRDSKGALVGTIASVSMSAAVLKTESGSVEVPLEAFGKNSRGLLIGMSKAEFDALVAQANRAVQR